MEALKVLEEKVAILIATLKDLRLENARLGEENTILAEKLEKLECSLLEGNKNAKEMSEEKVMAKKAVDELIKSIDSFVVINEEQSR